MPTFHFYPPEKARKPEVQKRNIKVLLEDMFLCENYALIGYTSRLNAIQ